MQKQGRNESNELSSNNLRFFQNNLGLVFHTTYSCIFHSCIFHPCDLLLLFPLPWLFWHFGQWREARFILPPPSQRVTTTCNCSLFQVATDRKTNSILQHARKMMIPQFIRPWPSNIVSTSHHYLAVAKTKTRLAHGLLVRPCVACLPAWLCLQWSAPMTFYVV